MARQGDVARVEQRQHVPEQIRLGLVADLVADAVLAEWLLHELAAVVTVQVHGCYLAIPVLRITSPVTVVFELPTGTAVILCTIATPNTPNRSEL
jgi:hypothetical protein